MKKIFNKVIILAVIVSMAIASTLTVHAGYVYKEITPKQFNTGYGTATAELELLMYPELGNYKGIGITTRVSTTVPSIVDTCSVVDYYSGATIIPSTSKVEKNTNLGNFGMSFRRSNCKVTAFGAHEVRGYSAWGVNTALYGVYMA